MLKPVAMAGKISGSYAAVIAGQILPGGRTTNFAMNSEISIGWFIAGAIALAVIGGGMASYFAPQARADRRRRKSNAPIVNKSNRPTVKFSVRTKKD